MSIIHSILSNYGNFFSAHEIVSELSSPTTWAVILTLIVMEGLLSADNALVLAMMVKHLPEDKQKKALTYGIFGAYIFRFIAIGIGTFLIKIWWVKLIAAAYLLQMVLRFFLKKDNEDSKVKVVNKGFWATVATVELMDIAFSIDSVTAAFGVSNKVWALFLGAVFGILMMRCIAKVFVRLIDKIPEFETSAYVLIGIIAVRMIVEVTGVKIPDVLFFTLLAVTLVGTFVVHTIRNKKIRVSE